MRTSTTAASTVLPQSKVIIHRPDVSSTPIRPQSSIPQKRHSPSPSTSPKKRVKTGVPSSALGGRLSNQLVLTTRSNQQTYKHWRTPVKHKYCRSFAVRIGNLETWRVLPPYLSSLRIPRTRYLFIHLPPVLPRHVRRESPLHRI